MPFFSYVTLINTIGQCCRSGITNNGHWILTMSKETKKKKHHLFCLGTKLIRMIIPRTPELILGGKLGVFRRLCENLPAWFLPLLESPGVGTFNTRTVVTKACAAVRRWGTPKSWTWAAYRYLLRTLPIRSSRTVRDTYWMHLPILWLLHQVSGLISGWLVLPRSAGGLFDHCEKVLPRLQVAGRRLRHQKL